MLVSDSFVRADSASSAGSTDNAQGGLVSAWTASGGATFGIAGNRLYSPVAANGIALVGVPQSYMDVRAVIATLPATAFVGIMAAAADAGNNVQAQVATNGSVVLYSFISGSATALVTLPAGSVNAGDEVGVRVEQTVALSSPLDGVVASLLVNGVVKGICEPLVAIGPNAGISTNNTLWRISSFRVLPPPRRNGFARVGSVLVPSGLETECLAPDVKFINGQWVMLYSPSSNTHAGTPFNNVAQSLAYSSDLVNWTKEPANPILAPISEDNGFASDGTMCLFGGIYYLYYNSYTGSAFHLRLATASAVNGPYTRQGIVSGMDVMSSPTVRVIAGGTQLEMYGGTGGFWRSTSSDGITWSTPVNIFNAPFPGVPTLDLDTIYVVNDSAGTYHAFYSCGITSGARRIFEAVSSSPTGPWTHRPWRLGPGPSGQFDDYQVFDCSPVILGDTTYLFYAGSRINGIDVGLSADIGLAIAPNWPV